MSVDAITFENLVGFVWDGETATMHPLVQDHTILGYLKSLFGREFLDSHSDWNNKDEPKYNLDEGNNEYNPYGPNGGNNKIEWTDLTDELPKYNIDDLKGDTNPLDYFKYYRFIINAFLVGIPWAVTA